MIFITKRVMFSAAHRLHNPEYSDKQNEENFDKCNNYYGHGHNYTLEVTIVGKPNKSTGYLIDLKILKNILMKEIVDEVDHKHLNYDVDFLRGVIPTVEHLCIVFWDILKDKIPDAKLHCIKLFETEDSYAEYYGEPIEIIKFK